MIAPFRLSGSTLRLTLPLVFLSLGRLWAQDTTALGFVQGTYQLDVFSSALMPWHTAGMLVTRTLNRSTWLAEMELGQRFGGFSGKVGMALYHKRLMGDYWLVEGAYGIGRGYPLAMAGGEYFHPFRSWEVSGGARWMVFAGPNTLWSASGSVSKYHGRWLSSVRPTVAWLSNTNEMAFGARGYTRYYVTDHQYWQAAVLYGYDPTLVLQMGGAVPFDPRVYLVGGELAYQGGTSSFRAFSARYGITYYQLVSIQRWQHTLAVGYKIPYSERK